MKDSKRLLSKALYLVLEGNKEAASIELKKYFSHKKASIIKEYDYDYDYDYDREDARADAYDSSDRFNDVEEIEETCTLNINGHTVTFKFKAEQDVAVDGEPATFHDPGWSEIVEYGLIKNLEVLSDFTIDGVLVTDELIVFSGDDADDVKTCTENLTYAIEDLGGEIDPKVKEIITPEFSKLFALQFHKFLKSKEDYA